MKRAASYARFSTDMQNDRSNADQHAGNRKLASHLKYSIVKECEDAALSGTSIKNRAGIQNILRMAQAGEIDAVIAESTSRLGRDQEDRAHFRKRMEFYGVEIVTVANGVVTELVDGITAVFDSQQIRDLRQAVRRGQRGATERGKIAGGLCYGYAPVKGEPGMRTIVEEEAEVVRRIYAEFLAGKSPRAICVGLNADDIKPPQGRSWCASTLNGNAKRGAGILRNSIYAGRLTWNRVSMVKDPDSEKNHRISRPNDPKEWVVKDVPELAIVSTAQFDAVQKRKAALAHVYPGRQKRPRYILSGLLRCGCCAGGMSVSGIDSSGRMRIRCSTRKEGGFCSSPKTFYLDTVENLVLDKLRDELAHPEAIAAFVRGYHEEHRRLANTAGARRAKLERRRGEIDREIGRLIDAIAKGHGDPAVLGPRSSELDAERKRLDRDLAAIEEPKVIALHPAAMARYEQTVARLRTAIGGAVANGDAEATDAMRELIESVTVTRTQDERTEIVIAGRLNALLGIPAFPEGIRSSCRKVVAGAGYRQQTQLNILRFELRAAA